VQNALLRTPFCFLSLLEKGSKDLVSYSKDIYNSLSNNIKTVGGSLKYNLQQRMHAFTLKGTKKPLARR